MENDYTEFYLVTAVYPKYYILQNLTTRKIVKPSIDSVFVSFLNLIGTADSHPELLI